MDMQISTTAGFCMRQQCHVHGPVGGRAGAPSLPCYRDDGRAAAEAVRSHQTLVSPCRQRTCSQSPTRGCHYDRETRGCTDHRRQRDAQYNAGRPGDGASRPQRTPVGDGGKFLRTLSLQAALQTTLNGSQSCPQLHGHRPDAPPSDPKRLRAPHLPSSDRATLSSPRAQPPHLPPQYAVARGGTSSPRPGNRKRLFFRRKESGAAKVYELFESRVLSLPCSDHSEVTKALFLPLICLTVEWSRGRSLVAVQPLKCAKRDLSAGCR
nr:uncharacterized protein LOC106782163 [Equus caballus]